MNILLLLFIVYTVYGKDEFGTSYLKGQRLCRAWSCINTKLGLPDSLPPRDQYSQVLKSSLAETWHGAVDSALEACYCDSCNRTRRYNNACPGQALLECTVDQLIKNCPEHSWRRNDACSTVTALAGFKYMFSQSIYENLEANLPYDQRPTWFMRHYFSNKCCNLPEFFNSTLLSECGFTNFMEYHRFNSPASTTTASTPVLPDSKDEFKIQVVELPPVTQAADESTEDPLECCDMSGFIQPSWRTECDFRLKWDVQDRLTIEKPLVTTTTAPTTTTTAKPRLDVKVLPLSCTQETCVFRKLNVISESGAVDIDAFTQLLNNLTAEHPSWTKAKARVVTKCLTRPLISYVEDCEINKVLACTFDVLSENCPTAKKNDPCKRSSTATNDIVCQISSAKFVPKNRRQYCDVPSLVDNAMVLQECGISSINRLEYSTQTIPVPSRRLVPVSMCTKLTDSTTCLLSKMNVLNKYQFMDYFKMKASIRDFTSTHSEWLALNDAYLSALSTMPMYREYCSSPKKLLNLIDTMLMTCPMSKRKSSPKCYKIFNEISKSPMLNPNATKLQLEQILNQFQHIFTPTPTHQNVLRDTHKNHKKMYSFGILDDGNAPPVRVIDVNPTARPIKVVLPVYQQIYGNMGGDMTNMHSDARLRGGIGTGFYRPTPLQPIPIPWPIG